MQTCTASKMLKAAKQRLKGQAKTVGTDSRAKPIDAPNGKEPLAMVGVRFNRVRVKSPQSTAPPLNYRWDR